MIPNYLIRKSFSLTSQTKKFGLEVLRYMNLLTAHIGLVVGLYCSTLKNFIEVIHASYI